MGMQDLMDLAFYATRSDEYDRAGLGVSSRNSTRQGEKAERSLNIQRMHSNVKLRQKFPQPSCEITDGNETMKPLSFGATKLRKFLGKICASAINVIDTL
jgi:hypothetical protein